MTKGLSNIRDTSIIDKIIRQLFYFLILTVPLIFFTNLTQNPFFIQIVLFQITVSIIFILYIFKINLDKEFKIITTPLDYPLLFLVLVCSVSLIFSLIRHKDTRLAIFIMGFDNIVFILLNWVAIFYITVYTIKNSDCIKRVINILFIAGGIASLYGILQYFKIEPIWPNNVDPFGGRCVSTFGNPNFLASFLVLLLPVSLVNILLAQKISQKIFLFIISSLLFTALICTSTRSAWIGFIISVFLIWIFLIFNIKDRKIVKNHFIYLVLIGMVSLVIILNAPGKQVVSERALTIFNIQKSGAASSQRFLIWESAKDMFLDYPFTGVGWGTLELFYPMYQGKYLKENIKYFPLKTHANRAHNEILQFLSETGIAGLGISIWLFISFVYYVLKLFKNNLASEDKYIIIGLFSGVIGMLIDNMLNVSLHFTSPSMVFWISVGMIVSIGNKSLNRQIYTINFKDINYLGQWLLKKLVSLIVLFLLIGLVWLNFNKFKAAIHYFNGLRYNQDKHAILDKAAYEFETSIKFYPFDVNTNYELGNVYASQGKINQAIEYYNKANLINFGYEEIYYNLGIMYAVKNEFDKSIYNFEKALQIGPDSLDTYIRLGKIYIRLNDWPNAQKVYEKIVFLRPSLTEAHLNLGNIYFNLDNIKKAISEYEETLKLDPKNAGAYENLGYAYLKIEKKQEAIKAFTEALRLNPENKLVNDRLRELK